MAADRKAPARLRAAWLIALTTAWLLAAAPAGAQTAEPRFDVLVFSKTTGFRHAEAIDAGHAAIDQMAAARNFRVTHSEDSSLFTDDGLRPYEVVVFLDTDGEGILDAAQRTAFERWTQHGGGIVGIHADANADRNWAWKGDMMGGAWFNNHPAGDLQFQTATVNRVDDTHPATVDVPENWVREDEWYNFTAEPQNVHVLLSLDESTYEEQDGTPEADEHPIAWCSNYDGGRHFYTALGHHGGYWAEPDYRDHILGAIEWASGEAPGDCGPEREGIPTDAAFDKVTLDDTTENPMELTVAGDGAVYYVELAGKVKRYDLAANEVDVIGTIPVHRGNENGLLGITLDPQFDTNRWIYLFYSAPSPEVQHVSRFTLNADGTIDMASEKVLLEFPHQRIVCCHSSGSLAFGPDGNLYISTGDDTEHSQSQGYAPLDDRPRDNPGTNPDADHAYDSRRTSGNTNDLRGKILRITPKPDGTYTIPPGNLFPPFSSDPAKTRPEIYTMGHRNPFRIAIDSETGWLYNGEVGPDANADNPNRGPRGYDELNQIRQAGNMGWPYCIANNKAYNDYDFATGVSGPKFDCANGPLNDSAWNTGLSQVPAATGALLYWPYGPSPDFPAIPNGPGRTAIAGPIYHFDGANPSETKLPAYYDDKVFFADWSRDWIATLTLEADGSPGGIEEFMPGADFRHPQDIEMGANGSLYLLEWGRDFNYAGSGVNPDSGLYRIDFAKGARTPVAKASADKDSGPAPLEVTFSSEGSTDADGDDLTFAWNFDDGSTATGAEATHTFTQPGTYRVRLIATDSTGKSGTSTVTIDVGNTRPTVTLEAPVQGGVFDWGDEIPYTVTVTDPEDETIDCGRVTVNPGIFHDEGGNAHVHPGVSETGCSGTFEAPESSGHAKSANIALVLTATYTDTGGAPGSSPLEGASTRRLNPKTIQAEHYVAQTGTQTNTVGNAEGGRTVGYADEGEWIAFEPVSLKGIDEVTIHYAAGFQGGMADFRLDAPDGPVVGTASLPSTGSWTAFRNVTVPITTDDEAGHRLYVTFKRLPGENERDLFDLDELTFIGKGVSSNSAPTASAQADKTAGAIPLTVNFTGSGADADGDPLTYAWDFESDGTVDATTADASHTYSAAGNHKATFTVSDGERQRSVEIQIATYPPVESCPGDDEFSGTALDPKWTVVRPDPQRLSVANGSLNIVSAKQDIHGGANGMPNIVLQDLPDGVPWTATTRVTWNPTENYQNAGLLIYESDSAWIKSGMVWANGRAFEAFKELDDSPQALGNGPAVPADFPSTFYLRFVSDGSSVQAQRSADGQTWTNTGNATNLNGLNDPKIGVYATASTSANPGTPTASFDFFQLAVPQEPSDEFSGDSLNTCRWSAIVRHDPAGYEVADGELVLPAAHGDFFGNAANNNPNIVLQPAPAGAWTAETRMRFVPNENYEQAGIVVYGDDANYVKADLVHAGGRAVEFLRETNNSAAGFGGTVQLPTGFPDTVELRVTSDGETLRAFYRPVGGEWKPFGEPAPLANVPAPKIGVYANDSNATVSSRDEAAFDYFRLTPGAPDDEPPVTTATLDPAAPDGQDGWYTRPVSVTLATEQGATTEYKVGDGAFRAYDAPFTLGADGTHVVTYRSKDAAGNVEGDKTVAFKIDGTGPDVACTAVPGVLWPPDGTFRPVAVGLDLDDAGSGPGSFWLESVTSSEGGTGFARNWRVGFADTAGELQAIRDENPTRGRTYSLAYRVFDRAGNEKPCVAEASVPRTKKP